MDSSNRHALNCGPKQTGALGLKPIKSHMRLLQVTLLHSVSNACVLAKLWGQAVDRSELQRNRKAFEARLHTCHLCSLKLLLYRTHMARFIQNA